MCVLCVLCVVCARERERKRVYVCAQDRWVRRVCEIGGQGERGGWERDGERAREREGEGRGIGIRTGRGLGRERGKGEG